MIGRKEMQLSVSKWSNNGQADEIEFFLPEANQSPPVTSIALLLYNQCVLACAMKQRRLCIFGRQEIQMSGSVRDFFCNKRQCHIPSPSGPTPTTQNIQPVDVICRWRLTVLRLACCASFTVV